MADKRNINDLLYRFGKLDKAHLCLESQHRRAHTSIACWLHEYAEWATQTVPSGPTAAAGQSSSLGEAVNCVVDGASSARTRACGRLSATARTGMPTFRNRGTERCMARSLAMREARCARPSELLRAAHTMIGDAWQSCKVSEPFVSLAPVQGRSAFGGLEGVALT